MVEIQVAVVSMVLEVVLLAEVVTPEVALPYIEDLNIGIRIRSISKRRWHPMWRPTERRNLYSIISWPTGREIWGILHWG